MDEFASVPGTISEAARRIRWFRASNFPGGRTYLAEVPDGFLAAVVTRDEVAPGKFLWHLSLSHRDKDDGPDRCPTWDELKVAWYQLVRTDKCGVLILPRKNAPAPYVNIHDTCLHIWETDRELDV